MSSPADVLVVPGEGETITASERRDLVILADHEDISITRTRYAPGEWGPDPHFHREHTDAFYVLEGELVFILGAEAERVRATPGTFVAAPPNVVHSFGNESDATAWFLNFHTPGKGFTDYLRGRRDGRDVPFDSFDASAGGGPPASEAIVSGPGEGERLVSGNRAVLMKYSRADMSFADWTIDGRFNGPEIHRHEAQVDSFYVIDGELEMTVEETVETAGPGTLASVPRGVDHTFHHTRPGPARILNIHAPDGGFAAFLRSISD